MNTHDIELPPLPKGDIAADTCPVMWVHSNEQLQEYALAVLQSEQVKSWKRDAERYRALRSAAINENFEFLDAAEMYQEKHFADPVRPTVEEFDACIDHARRIEGDGE